MSTLWKVIDGFLVLFWTVNGILVAMGEIILPTSLVATMCFVLALRALLRVLSSLATRSMLRELSGDDKMKW